MYSEIASFPSLKIVNKSKQTRMDKNVSKFRILEKLRIYERPTLEDLKVAKEQAKNPLNVPLNQSTGFTRFSDLLNSSFKEAYKKKEEVRPSKSSIKNVVQAIAMDFENLDEPMVEYYSPPRKVLKSLENTGSQVVTLVVGEAAGAPPISGSYASSSSASEEESEELSSTFTTGKFPCSNSLIYSNF